MSTKPLMWWPGITRQHPLARGLVGYWPFWEGAGSGLSDYAHRGKTGAKLDGTLTNGPIWKSGRDIQGLDFEADNSTYIDFAGNYPYEATDLQGPGVTYSILIYKKSDDWSNNRYFIGGTTSAAHQDTAGGGMNCSAGVEDVARMWIFDGAWKSVTTGTDALKGIHHFVGVFDSPTNFMRMYHNGRASGTPVAFTPSGCTFSPTLFYIGRQPNTSTPGYLDNVVMGLAAVWARALSPQEIWRHWIDPFALSRRKPLSRRHVAAAVSVPDLVSVTPSMVLVPTPGVVAY